MENLIVVRGGGDIATGTICKLWACGYAVLALEIPAPSAIRRSVAFCEAAYTGAQTVEGITCRRADDLTHAKALLEKERIALLVDPAGACIPALQPMAVVDGILAKKNMGFRRDIAPITVALGPGFTAGQDCDAVVETMRGHSLGRVLYSGSALQNTGVPGAIGGYSRERVIHSPAAGILHPVRRITDTVHQGDLLAEVETADGQRVPVYATLTGLLRGLIRAGYPVTAGFKIADIDPRVDQQDNCFTVSDKARCIAGGVLEAIEHLDFVRRTEKIG